MNHSTTKSVYILVLIGREKEGYSRISI